MATYTLQILHASDFEAGLDAVGRAGNFAAIVDYLEETFTNSITLSSGDNYLPSPFFNAGGDPSMEEVLETAYEQFYHLPAGTLNLAASVGRADISILNIIGIQASTIGNHEYDAGTREVQNIIARTNSITGMAAGWIGTQFPYLSANTNFAGDPNLAPLFTSTIQNANAYVTPPTTVFPGAATAVNNNADRIAPATIIEENGRRIGVVGATTQIVQTISSTGGIEIIGDNENDMPELAAILQPTIDALAAQGVDIIVVASHLQQLSFEQQLLPLLHNVDIVIGGGSNTRLADSEDVTRGLRPGDAPDGTYPIVTTNADGQTALIVNTDGEFSYVGRLVVDFDDAGRIIPGSVNANVSGAFATTNEQVAALYSHPIDIDGDGDLDSDPFVSGSRGDLVNDIAQGIGAVIQTQDSRIFGRTDVYLEGRREEVRTQETNFGDLSADANLWYAQQVDGTVTVSIKNGGGIRDSIGRVEAVGGVSQELPPEPNPGANSAEGDVSQLDIANSLRFNNALSLITVTPAQLLQVLEHAVAATAPGATPGQFAQIGGIAYSFDDDLPAGNRVVSADFIDEDGNPIGALVRNGELVADVPSAIRIVTLTFLITGGDGYPFQSFVNVNSTFANVVNLSESNVPPGGVADFAQRGTEQDALAEYLAANYRNTPYNQLDLGPVDDQRIQNLDFRGDTLRATAGADQIIGHDPSGSAVVGLAGDDSINGLGGPDALFGNQGNDTINPGGGRDTVYGGQGDDSAAGQSSNEMLLGNEGADTLAAGEGNNTIVGGNGSADAADLITAGSGNDLILGNGGTDTIVSGAGADTVVGGFNNDYIVAGDGADVLLGNQDNDTIEAGDGADLIFGGFGNDTIVAGLGNDSILGNEGNDTIAGQDGNDTMAGGTGADRFVFLFGPGSDQINGFCFDEGDRLDLQAQTFTQGASTDGDVLLTLSGGGTIELNGIAPANFSPTFVA
jgi:2',3'-cyclic-nucleotide 2'-phosphodiesterase (5'-nucleotidase family)